MDDVDTPRSRRLRFTTSCICKFNGFFAVAGGGLTMIYVWVLSAEEFVWKGIFFLTTYIRWVLLPSTIAETIVTKSTDTAGHTGRSFLSASRHVGHFWLCYYNARAGTFPSAGDIGCAGTPWYWDALCRVRRGRQGGRTRVLGRRAGGVCR